MCSAASAVSRSGPLRFTAIVLSNSSAVTSSSDGGTGAMPALLTSTSTRPNSAIVASMSAAHWSQSPTWHARRARGGPGRGFPRRPPRTRSSFDCDDDVGSRFPESQRHRASRALAGAGDDHDLAGRVEVGDAHRRVRRRVRVRPGGGDAVDEVADVEVEQRLGFGRRDAARVAPGAAVRRPAGGSTRLDRAETDRRPHQQPARLHGGVGPKPSRRITLRSGRDASTYASRPGDRSRRLSRARRRADAEPVRPPHA